MTDQAAMDWPTCEEPGCIGIRLPRGGKCLAHATTRRRTLALRQLHETGEIDARGVPITQALLQQILAAAPHDAEDHPIFKTADFEWATFGGDTGFGGATFQGVARFGGATFDGVAGFEGATFEDAAGFEGATFEDAAGFEGTNFEDAAGFDRATFRAIARFFGTTFQGTARFGWATFQANAWFGKATFQGMAGFDETIFRGIAGFYGTTFEDYAGFGKTTFQDARFVGATFQEAWFGGATFQEAWFVEATFQVTAGFDGVIFRRSANFSRARFEQARQLGPLLVYGLLQLDAAHFAQLALIEASSRGLSCQRTRFPAGVQFRLRGAQVVLDEADLPSPSLLTGIDILSDPRLARREQRLVQSLQRLTPAAAKKEFSERPRLLSVQGANLAGLGVANIDLAQCRFARAHNLDKLRFETEVSFAAAPARLPWDRRQVLAEERAWWAAQSNRNFRRWAAAGADWWPAWLHKPYRTEWPEVVQPAQLAGLYRALRKAREDAKDEPGAADFYYGEMEMRRHARRGRTGEASRGLVERGVLTAYWLVSGYGLRAWRALTALAVILVAFAGLLVLGGYEDAASSPDAGPTSTTMARSGPSSSTAAPARPSARSAPTTAAAAASPAAATTAASPAASVADRSLVGALLYGARTIIGLNPTPAPVLTQFGQVLLIAVRLTGPLLLALALFALRGRVKR